ncbi:MAG: sugar-binding domain-containing protein, partial [Alphaproteobacteria bacterium]
MRVSKINFLGLVSIAAMALATAPAAAVPASATAQPGAQAAGPRQIVSLASGWRFRFGGDADGVTAPTFDDSSWERIDLPHTWNRMGEYQLTRSAQSNLEQGIGWYRLALTAPSRAKGQRQLIQFDGVGAIAEIWVNGVRVGGHAGAFSTFRFDITDQLRAGASNSIVVKADNSKPAPGSSTAD